jgi:GDPmannose 4,6-dehydratase
LRRTHLITGVTGQDGVLLSRLLVGQGDRVVGTTTEGALESAGEPAPDLGQVELVELDVRDTDSFGRLVDRVSPDVVHNLAAQSSVGASWEDAETTREINATAVRDMLQLLGRLSDPPAFVQASSSEIYGATKGPDGFVDEDLPLTPLSPYAEAKADAQLAVGEARRQGLAATNLILFGHTSRLQDPQFVLPTVTRQAAEVALGRREAVTLRNPLVRRDWGSAEDFVRAFALAAEAPPGDYIVATGRLHELSEIAQWALAAVGAQGAVGATEEAPRERDFDGAKGDVTRAAQALGWTPQISLRTEIERMAQADVRRLGEQPGPGA